MLPKPTNTQGKVLSLKGALALRRKWKRLGLRVVFTNGVYDLLHPGHILLLETARSFGDKLIVGVNTDASARRLGKAGPPRPINPLAARCRVLAALACVEAVTSFREDTPERLLSMLKPEVLVKGADYRPEQVVGRQHAGQVRLVALKTGFSTTKILTRLRGS